MLGLGTQLAERGRLSAGEAMLNVLRAGKRAAECFGRKGLGA